MNEVMNDERNDERNKKKISKLSTYALYLAIIFSRNLLIFMVSKELLEYIGLRVRVTFIIMWALPAISLLFYWGFRAWEKVHSLDSKDIFEVFKDR